MSSQHEAYLRSSLSKYQYPDIAKRDILNAFQTFTDLRPKLDAFVFNDGNRKELLSLDGTIPVTYKGTQYNIPLCLWLMDTHPYNPPMVYVKPTTTMQIKPGRHVDSNGKVYLPYLHEWKHPQSDLLGLVQILAIVFGDEPPVFSRSSPVPPPRPPYQPGTGSTPYPSQGGGMPVPYPPTSSTGGYQPPTSYPQTTSYPGYPSQGGGYPAQTQGAGYPGGGTGAQQSGAFPSYPNYPQQQAYPQQSAATGTSATQQQQQQALSEDQIKASLLTAVEEKMRRRLRDIFAQSQAEVDVLRRTQEDLNKGKATLDDMLHKLEREQNDVEHNIRILQEKDTEIKDVLCKMENREEVNIDEAVIPTAPLYKQIMNAFAEEQATEDAIYYLGEALRRGVMDLDVFLKQVRELSRKQYMLRALMHKCRQKAGLSV